MNNKFKRMLYILKTIIHGGFTSFFYLVRTTLRNMKSKDKKYKAWQKAQKEDVPITNEKLQKMPYFSLLLLGETDKNWDEIYVNNQEYPNMEVLTDCESRTWKQILEQTKGEYIGILGKGDYLSSNAVKKLLFRMEKEYNQDKMLIYSDEDCYRRDGERCNPFFKPDYSPDTLRSFFYMGGFLVMKRELAEKLEFQMNLPILFRGYLLALEASFLVEAKQVYHITEVLYHRQSLEPKSKKTSLHADNFSSLYDRTQNHAVPDIKQLGEYKEQLFKQYGMDVRTEKVPDCDEVRIIYELREEPKVSIIIPSKDNPSMLRVCMESIASHTAYDNYEIVVIDNGSNPENKKAYEMLSQEQKKPCYYYYRPMEFNFSKMCNMGAEHATGEYYLFLNDDIELSEELTKKDWLKRLMGQAVQPHTGAVGAKLYYPASDCIQHAGVVNYESGPSHILGRMRDDTPLGFGRNRLDYNYMTVTGACFLIQKEKFKEVEGFREELAVTYNDVDLGMKLVEAGYYNVVRNDVVMYHHESISRGVDTIDSKKFVKHLKEREKLFALHPAFVKRDPFYNRHLTQRGGDCGINTEFRLKCFDTVTDISQLGETAEKELSITCTVEYAKREEEQVCVRGFAFAQELRYNNLNQIFVGLMGQKETIYGKTMKLYNHTISVQMESKKNLNFTEFYTVIPVERLHENRYQVGVVLRPFGSKRVHTAMTEVVLDLHL